MLLAPTSSKLPAQGSLHCSPCSLILFDTCRAGTMGECKPRALKATSGKMATDLQTPRHTLAQSWCTKICHSKFRLSTPPPTPVCVCVCVRECGPEAPGVTPTRVPKECGYGNFTRRSRTGSVVVCVAPSPAQGSLWHKPLTHRVGLATCLAGVGHTPIPPHPGKQYPVPCLLYDLLLLSDVIHWGAGAACSSVSHLSHYSYCPRSVPLAEAHVQSSRGSWGLEGCDHDKRCGKLQHRAGGVADQHITYQSHPAFAGILPGVQQAHLHPTSGQTTPCRGFLDDEQDLWQYGAHNKCKTTNPPPPLQWREEDNCTADLRVQMPQKTA